MGQPPVAYSTSDPYRDVQLPATFLIAVAAIGILGQLLGLVMNVLGMGMAGLADQPGGDAIPMMMQGTMGIIGSIIGILVGAFIIYGALQMKQLVNYPLAVAASAVAMVPCLSPCCCLGLPVGIWCLVILMRADVKAAFR